MKTGYLVLIAAGASALASAAFAQTPQQASQRWTDPTGAWSIDYASVGWGAAGELPRGGTTTLMIAPIRPPADDEVRICLAEQIVSKIPAAKDAARYVTDVSEQALAKVYPRLEFASAKISRLDIDGVVVVDLDGKSGNSHMRGRFFFTPHKDGSVQTKISCVLSGNLRPELAAEVEAVLGSLKFNAN
jgi:hypothetical protein